MIVRCTLAGAALLAALLPLVNIRAGDDDFWSGWRARQRAELATLPKPSDPRAGIGEPVDRFHAAGWKKQHFIPPDPVDDRVLARRLYLDVIGILPTPGQLDDFAENPGASKYVRLVDKLLADQDAYAEHWITFWNDLLRNDEQSNIDGLRKPITRWLYDALRENMPLDLFVAKLLDPGSDGPDGYLKGVNWRGRVNASQAPPVQAAQNVSQVFLGSSIKCASCHDSFINQWKLKQAYGMASFFAEQDLEIHRCDKPTGKSAAAEFLFAGLGEVPAGADLDTRHRAVARMVTRPQNPRFARTLVNRLWKRLLGRGLIEPADDLDSQPARSDLLDWLAYDLMNHDYDAKHALRTILLSRVYALPVVRAPAPSQGDEVPVPAGPVERRLTSEQFLDAVAQVTDYWPHPAVMKVRVPNPQVRAWRHRKPDALATALGRPNREQVCTERSQESTVLQALELVNGAAFEERLRGGADHLLDSELADEPDLEQVCRTMYLKALGRQPTSAEVDSARRFLGSPSEEPESRRDGWQDFLWTVFMSPEFQFIR
jgi:hypothetical protein